jgi:hypothetical protein
MQRRQKSDAPCDESLRGRQVCPKNDDETMPIFLRAKEAICLIHLVRSANELGALRILWDLGAEPARPSHVILGENPYQRRNSASRLDPEFS